MCCKQAGWPTTNCYSQPPLSWSLVVPDSWPTTNCYNQLPLSWSLVGPDSWPATNQPFPTLISGSIWQLTDFKLLQPATGTPTLISGCTRQLTNNKWLKPATPILITGCTRQLTDHKLLQPATAYPDLWLHPTADQPETATTNHSLSWSLAASNSWPITDHISDHESIK